MHIKSRATKNHIAAAQQTGCIARFWSFRYVARKKVRNSKYIHIPILEWPLIAYHLLCVCVWKKWKNHWKSASHRAFTNALTQQRSFMRETCDAITSDAVYGKKTHHHNIIENKFSCQLKMCGRPSIFYCKISI